MNWKQGELRRIEIGVAKKRRNRIEPEIVYTVKQIPAPYDRIICQLIAEEEHGNIHISHEAVRRQRYAQQVLDLFAEEINAYRGLASRFRSYVLTPILQRQLLGVHDAYRPSVSDAVGCGSRNPTIGQVTEFYLTVDPTDAALIGSYRYNAVFIPEVRWHLGIVVGIFRLGDSSSYNRIKEHHDDLMAVLRAESEEDVDSNQVPLFSEAMVKVVIDEGLDLFFGSELGRVVGNFSHLHIASLISGAFSESWLVQFGNIG